MCPLPSKGMLYVAMQVIQQGSWMPKYKEQLNTYLNDEQRD